MKLNYEAFPNFEENLDYVHQVGVHSVVFFQGKAEGGYHLQQNPGEMAGFLSYLKERFPQGMSRYLEIGSASGGFIRCISERVGFEYALMMDFGLIQVEMQESNIERFKSKVKRVIIDSHSEGAHTLLASEAPFDVIFIDGDHEKNGVALDIDLVLEHASGPDTLICFHDIYCLHVPGVGEAYREAIASGKIREVGMIQAELNNPLGIAITKRGQK